MDQWKDDALYHSPEVMLSNSSGAYGVTISEPVSYTHLGGGDAGLHAGHLFR